MGPTDLRPRLAHRPWTVYDSLKPPAIPPASPESLMTEIDAAIKKMEYTRASSLLLAPSPSPRLPPPREKQQQIQYDARKADEAYRAGCAALAAGKLDEALHSLNVSLSNCPPEKTSAVAKLHSLISLTSSHLHRSPASSSPLWQMKKQFHVFFLNAFTNQIAIKSLQFLIYKCYSLEQFRPHQELTCDSREFPSINIRFVPSEQVLALHLHLQHPELPFPLCTISYQSARFFHLVGSLKWLLSLGRKMGVFYQEEPANASRRFKFISATLRGALSSCRDCGGRRLSTSSPIDECLTSELEDEHEEIVSAIRSRAMEKLKHRPVLLTDSFSCIFSPKTGELFVSTKNVHEETRDDDGEEFFSVRSCLSCCSSALSKEAFFSIKTNLSRSSSFNGLDEFPDLWKRSTIFLELCHCEGWPFGLCRKAVLLPPLPKSPSESWSWKKVNRITKPH